VWEKLNFGTLEQVEHVVNTVLYKGLRTHSSESSFNP